MMRFFFALQEQGRDDASFEKRWSRWRN